jgi:hypothetical protein
MAQSLATLRGNALTTDLAVPFKAPVTIGTPSNGQVLKHNGTAWVNGIDETGAGGVSDGSITLAKMADLAADRVIGRANGAGTGVPQALTPAQQKAILALVKADVGLGSVDNTADTAKPVSTAQQAALDLKAPIASPTFTGTVAGVTKTHVGLGNVDNTSDAAKPVSTAQQTALDLKLALAGGTLTGGVKVRSGSVTGALSNAYSGGVYTTSGNVTLPNEAGFSITLVAGGAHTVGAGGATLALASGDMLSVVVPAVGTVRAVKVLAADVLTLATV